MTDWTPLLTYLEARKTLAEAEQSALKDLIAQVQAVSAKPSMHVDAFDPAWKYGTRLTTPGRQALEQAFAQGLRQTEAARLFKISLTRAHLLHKEWRQQNGLRSADHD